MSGRGDVDISGLLAAVPEAVVEICATLTRAGYQAFTVGGAVRDTLLGRSAGDWDVTTSAHPDDVGALFRRVLPTGIEHGTVTVVVGRGWSKQSVEVTSFRGEAGYSDGRRPDRVEFGVSLEEDLKRRDFLINAIAFDPVADELLDPLGGIDDLRHRVIRAVGDPVRRFAEDGLRIMRAVRFAATLEFDVEKETEEAIPGAIPSLERVSRERVHDELFKLLKATAPTLGLEVALSSGILASVFPEYRHRHMNEWADIMSRIDACRADPVIRGALLLGGVVSDPESSRAAKTQADAICRRLKWSNQDRKRVLRLIEFAQPSKWQDVDEVAIRRHLVNVGRDAIDDLQTCLAAHGVADAAIASVVDEIERIAASDSPLAVGELAIRGRDLIEHAGYSPGPALGHTLERLLSDALVDPAINTRAELLRRARLLAEDSGT